MTIPLKIQKQIAKYAPVTVDGLTLYPILVENYSEFNLASPAIEFLQQSLPVRLMSEPLLAAFWRLDYEARLNNEEPIGLFYRAMVFLALAMRLDVIEDLERLTSIMSVETDENDMARLRAVSLQDNDGETHKITPVLFQRLRPILAAQNGIELLSDSANPELVEAEMIIASQSGVDLEASTEALITSVAAMSGVDEAEVFGWPIKKLNDRKAAYEKVLNYIVCSIGEAQGASWKGGNPCPSPWFKRKKTGSTALMNLNDFAGGAGTKAIQDAGGLA